MDLGSNLSRRFWGPLPFEYPDGSTSTQNYCPSQDRYTLFSGTPVTQDVCGIFSCQFYSTSCGYWFYTKAQPGNENSKAVCKCCKPNPTIYKSSLGNKIYEC